MIHLQKSKTREKYKKIRNGLSPAYREKAANSIARKLVASQEFQRAQVIGIYMGKGNEVKTVGILKAALRLNKTVTAPKVSGKSLKFLKIKSLKDCSKGMFGILEPKSGCPRVPAAKIDLLLVPGIAFDHKGHRLGYGAGFYDRFLKSLKKTLKVGLTYSKTLASSLPVHKDDQAVDWIVTERKILRPGSR